MDSSLILTQLPMWMTFAVIAAALVFYAMEWASIEIVSLGAIVLLMAVAAFAPGVDFTPEDLLLGFSNPALVTILSLLIVGQGLIQTESLARLTEALSNLWPKHPTRVVALALFIAAAISSVVNNTPVVVVFMPVLAAVLTRRNLSASHYMMPLSYVTILGGMTTVLGSSTNLLAAGIAQKAGVHSVTLLSFAVPGLAMALAGGLYAFFVVPRLLPHTAETQSGTRRSTQFITEIHLGPEHPLVGDHTVAGMFPKLTNMTVRAVKRGRIDFLPPFDDITLKPGDTLIIAATRDTLTEAIRTWHMLDVHTGAVSGMDDDDDDANLILCESLVPPGSRLINNGIDQAGFMAQHGVLILGVERRSRMPRQLLSELRLEAGDVLLIAGRPKALERMRGLQDLVVLEWSADEVKPTGRTARAWTIFAATIIAIASGLVPIVAAAIAGAFAMIVSGCLNVRQAGRALDRRVIMLVGASIAMATAMEATGGADAVAGLAVSLLSGQSPAVYMAGLFLVVAVLTNVLSNNATAVLFTPVAIATAAQLGIDPLPFVVSVILGANASFATPIGYQTNLLVMGAGHYRFRDFVLVGSPLVLLVWIVFCLVAPWYYGV
ncbi:MAG: SLC13 family permease [Alphaproteobacteria bacterium]|nr:SLC13 family permease [Alphaproteobacteria bacterium]